MKEWGNWRFITSLSKSTMGKSLSQPKVTQEWYKIVKIVSYPGNCKYHIISPIICIFRFMNYNSGTDEEWIGLNLKLDKLQTQWVDISPRFLSKEFPDHIPDVLLVHNVWKDMWVYHTGKC